MSRSGVRILYIAGAGRSGTNVLGQILGQADGFCFVGEAMYAGPSLATRRCGCGVPLSDCQFWRSIRRDAGGGQPLDQRRFFGLGQRARWRHVPLTLGPGRGRRLAARYGPDWRACATLYAAVAAAASAEVIVDASKSVPYGRVLSFLPGLDLRIVHLVRDARAVVHSWQRLKPAPDRFSDPHMKRREPGLAAVFRMVSNAGAELLLRRAPTPYMRLRYEDLVARPRESLEAVLCFATERPVDIAFAGRAPWSLPPPTASAATRTACARAGRDP